MIKLVLFFFILGCDKLGLLKMIKAAKDYVLEYKKFKKQRGGGGNNDFILGKIYPILLDKYLSGGTTKGAYFHHDLLVARRIFENNPDLHYDVGSRVDGFVAHVASFRPIYILDIRPLETNIKNVIFIQQDLMAPLKNELIESCDSLSCLNALEHFGLGRYGDPINYNGHIAGLENLYKLLKPNGKLYLAVPIGLPQRINFNANRIFSVKYLLGLFAGRYRIDNFSYVDGDGNLHEDMSLNEKDINENYGCKGGPGSDSVGIFEMTKLVL